MTLSSKLATSIYTLKAKYLAYQHLLGNELAKRDGISRGVKIKAAIN
jgi:hypothetical protein